MKEIILKGFFSFLIVSLLSFPLSAQSLDYVDLDLPSHTLWATCNLGATKANEFGYYFAWGEIKKKKTKYTPQNYKHIKSGKLIKYCTDPEHGSVDNKTSLDPDDDAASCFWGNGWCIPSPEQVEELLQFCTTKETYQEGILGMQFIGKNNNSIFLPYGGVKLMDKTLYQNEDGSYWLNEISPNVPDIAAYFHVNQQEVRYHNRFNGYLIRPVRKP